MNRKALLPLAVAAAIGALALTACEPATEGGADTGTTPVAESAPADAAPAAPAAEGGPLALGQAYTYEDGLSVIVTAIDAVPLNQDNQFVEPIDAQVVTVQIQNGTAEAFDAGLFNASVDLSFGSAGLMATSEYVVIEDGYSGFEGQIAPGGTATARFPFSGVTDASTMTVTVEPSWDHEAAFWKK